MDGDFELEKIRQEIQQEKQMKEMLEQSAAELRATVEELENRYDTVDNEGNEWKTRYETQTEINEQLERQILNLQNKVQEAKSNLKDVRTRAGRNIQSRSSMMSNSIQGSGSIVDSKPGSATTKSTGIEINIAFSPREAGKTPRDMNRFDDLSDANPHMIRMLEKEKQMLSSQLRDLEWRLDQESKAYHKANDERKTYNLEINTTKHQHGEMSSRQRAMGSREQLDTISGSRTPRDLSRPSYQTKSSGTNNSRNSRKSGSHGSLSNIPEDQRIIDPKRGPIKKTAGVKNLPSLEMT
ncbi:coiled-coil domain-containing protein 169-like isoform X4 [Mytilus californianus]|uniref:coiled-coil domain-containing protein 169-like isoform X4 n=1 Tax=Mytilus californianus TaxID=6549 RepID=UPI0022453CA0|nr:coiled-coil domain-containing protein 169-like isoform X4 [Mytilus californianus]